jgi:hypothetical protein
VVASGPSWPPSRHPTIDELRIALDTYVGTEAEALGDTRPIAFDQGIRVRHEFQHELDRGGLLEIQRNRAAVPEQQIEG